MTITALLSHFYGLSLISFVKSPVYRTTSGIPLDLPSRFPKSSPALFSVSPTAHLYLYARDASHVWEYDSRGRRLSEMSFPNEQVQVILALEHKVIVAVERGLRIMEKEGGKWREIDTLEGPEDRVTAMVGSPDGKMVAVGSETGELVVYDQERGTRVVVSQGRMIKEPIKACMAFCPTAPTTLVIPNGDHLVLITIPSLETREVRPFPESRPGAVEDLAFSPVTEGKGGLCVVLKEGAGEVALVGLDKPHSASKVVDFGRDLVGVTFMDGATLAGWTKEGTLLIKDLRALSKEAEEIKVDDPITGVQIMPTLPKSARQSFAPPMSATSSRRTSVLGQLRNAGNIDTPPVHTHATGKGRSEEFLAAEVAKSGIETAQLQKKTVHLQQESARPRTVSAPSLASRPRQSTARSSSGPPDPSSSVTRPSTSASTGVVIPAPIVEEEEEPSPSHRHGQEKTADDLDLAWAIRPPGRVAQIQPDRGEEHVMEEMRREIANLQLDMLRMGRNLKNEIRRAVTPLLAEVKDGREVIERQRREIERLRRGY